MAEGRAIDTSINNNNNNNINYSLQDYSTSIEYFDKSLNIAKESNDKIGQRRAYVNLGNAYLYLEDFDKALSHYRNAITIGELMNDGLFIGQIHFILGRIYDLKQDYENAIFFHEKHLNLARQYQDSKGQCRAYFLLSQLYEKLNQYDKAKEFLNLYKELNRQIEKTNVPHTLRAESISLNQSQSTIFSSLRSNSAVASPTEDKSKKSKLNFIQHLTKKSPLQFRKDTTSSDPDELVDLVCRMQKSRFDDQRCDVKITNHQKTDNNHNSSHLDDILNSIDRLQQNRLNDQRTNFPQTAGLSNLNEKFLDQLAKCQGSRMNDQRAVLLPLPLSSQSRSITTAPIITTPTKNSFTSLSSTSKTLPDDDFFSILNRLQTRRTSLFKRNQIKN